MSRQRILEIALNELGVKENPPGSNRTKYGEWYGWDGYKWCAMFVSWVYHHAEVPIGKIDDPNGYRGCQSGYNYWKSRGELTKKPQPADIILFDWTGNGVCDHTGIFHSWITKDRTFLSIEGNTALGNDSDGGQVMRRTRQVESVRAFATPKVLGNIIRLKNDNLIRGDRGTEVVSIQRMFSDLGYSIAVDGYFGPKTESAVKRYQDMNGLVADGIVTPALRGLMEEDIVARLSPVTHLTNGSYLQSGDMGASVVSLQASLNRMYPQLNLEEDGVYGVKTIAAVRTFQQQKGLIIDGIAGPKTLSTLGIILI